VLSRNKPWTWTKEDERLRALVAEGASVVKAAAALKRKIISVRTRARALGCPFPPLRVIRQKWAVKPDDV
jgi:methionyl-tRNA synthetase